MKDKIALITGATSGIGLSTAAKLVSFGTELILLVRNKQKAEKVKSEISVGYPNAKIDLIEADLSSLKSVKKASEQILAKYPKIDILINNAGGIYEKYEQTEDGLGLGFQVNHLSHFLLTQKLLPVLLKSGNPRVINVSSEAHKMGNLDWNNLMGQNKFSAWKQYGAEKLMNILFAKELSKRYADQGLMSFALHPGVVKTSFASNNSGWLKFFNKLPFIITPDKGAETSIYCATQESNKLVSGAYYKKSSKSEHAKNAANTEAALKLWEESEILLKEKGLL